MSPAKMVTMLLEELGQTNGATGWLGVYSTMPDKTPDKVVAVFDDGAQLDGRSMRAPYTQWYHWSFQVVVRSVAYEDGWDKIMAVWDRLRITTGYTSTTIPGTPKFAGFYLRTAPMPMNRREEPNTRRLFVATFTFTLEE